MLIYRFSDKDDTSLRVGKKHNFLTLLIIYLFLTDSFTGCDWSGNTDEVTWDCCSSSSPCWTFEGDCDGDYDCIGHLICGSNNCFDSFSSGADCCYDPLGSKMILNQYVCSLITAGILKKDYPQKCLQNLAGILKKKLSYSEQYLVIKIYDDLFKNYLVFLVVRRLFIGIEFVLKIFSGYSLCKVLKGLVP